VKRKMPRRRSAGLLLFREHAAGVEVLLVHPGGPFWENKEEGAWSIPKGEFENNEEPLAAAKREFEEETGIAPAGEFTPLEPVKQPSGKVVYAWALHSDFDPHVLKSNMFSMEWPPRSGRQQEFPEVDRAAWFGLEAARLKILKGQKPFLDQLAEKIGGQSNLWTKDVSLKSRLIRGRRGASSQIDFVRGIRYSPAMPFHIDPTALVNLPCPRCGEKTAETVAVIQTSPRLRCPACGAMFAVNAQKVMEKLRAVEEQAELERRRRGV